MKKSLLTLAFCTASLLAGAQVVEVQSVTKVPVAGDLAVNIPRVSPDGRFAIVSTCDDNTLHRVDLTTGVTEKVADNGSALHLSFTPDGDNIVFKSSTTAQDRRRFYAVKLVELGTGYTRNLSKPARHCAGFTVSPAGVLSLSEAGRFSAQQLRGGSATATPVIGQPVVNIHYGHLELTMPDGTVTNLDPQGRGSYLWPNLSPDGTKISYFLVGKGCFVCDLDGTNVRPMGYFRTPAWLGNDALVAVDDEFDGDGIVAASIVAISLDGTVQTLTDNTVAAFNPWATADGKHITFSSAEGDLYVINLK